MISEYPVGYSGSRLDVCILSFVGRSGAETNEWQRGSRSVISAPILRVRATPDLKDKAIIQPDTLSFRLYQIEAKKLEKSQGSLVLLPRICYTFMFIFFV